MEQSRLIRRAFVYPSLGLVLWGPPLPPLGHRRTSIICSHKNEKSLHGSEVNEFCATNMKWFFFSSHKALISKERTKSQNFQSCLFSYTYWLAWVLDLHSEETVIWPVSSPHVRSMEFYGNVFLEEAGMLLYLARYILNHFPLTINVRINSIVAHHLVWDINWLLKD